MARYTNPDETDPISYEYAFEPHRSGWYFWDETWSEQHGPYNSYPEVVWALKDYTKEL